MQAGPQIDHVLQAVDRRQIEALGSPSGLRRRSTGSATIAEHKLPAAPAGEAMIRLNRQEGDLQAKLFPGLFRSRCGERKVGNRTPARKRDAQIAGVVGSVL